MFVVAGPCVIESADHALRVGEELAAIAERLSLRLIYKSSYDKANRTSVRSPRGPGLEEGLEILEKVKDRCGLEILTDIHAVEQAAVAAEVVDVLQIPAFLARQTDLVQAAAATGRAVNVKKGQFMAPSDMRHVIEKARSALPAGSTAEERIWVCERGTAFGYHDLVVDIRGLQEMRGFGCPVLFDASHSVQKPSGGDGISGGQREMIPVLARAAVAAGIDGFFIETHPNPVEAHSDSATVWPLQQLEPLLASLIDVDAACQRARQAF